MIDLYRRFRDGVSELQTLMKTEGFSRSKAYADIRHYLNICELIAVGINHGAFSETVAKAYWGSWLPSVYKQALPLIEFVRQTPSEGRPRTYVELEKLYRRWTKEEVT